MDLAVWVYRRDPNDRPEAGRAGYNHFAWLHPRELLGVAEKCPVLAAVVFGVEVATNVDRRRQDGLLPLAPGC